jgi:hypothetical protein
LEPWEALDRYLARPHDWQPGSADSVFALQVDASLPKLRKQGSMSGLRLISQAGQVVYRGLRFTGDDLVKTAVIARFLNNDAEPPRQAGRAGVTRENYSFVYHRTSDYNGQVTYVFRLAPKCKHIGLFKGELWLDKSTGAPLRLWGDLVKSPSIFIRSFRFVRDYQDVHQCTVPLRLLLTVRTRIAGEAKMVVWLHSVEDRSTLTGTDARGSDSVTSEGSACRSTKGGD